MKKKKKKIVLFGGSGFVGKLIQDRFEQDYELINISRYSTHSDRVWDGEHLGSWIKQLEGAFAIINLAGKSVNCRYTEHNKKAIITSRVNSTKVISEALKQVANPPKVWLNASSATIYEHNEHVPQTEKLGMLGDDFSPTVCKLWEKALFEKKLPIVRTALRMALVLDKSGGVLPEFMKLAKQGLGGTQGKGDQKVSWLAAEDLLGTIKFLIENPQEGIINLAAPNPITNQQFMKFIRTKVRVNYGLRLYPWMVRLGAFFRQTEAELVLKSRYVIPERLEQTGYEFKIQKLEEL